VILALDYIAINAGLNDDDSENVPMGRDCFAALPANDIVDSARERFRALVELTTAELKGALSAKTDSLLVSKFSWPLSPWSSHGHQTVHTHSAQRLNWLFKANI
jgi:hypothetical protein